MIRASTPIAGSDVAGHYDELDYFYRDVWGEHVHHGLWRTGRESRAEAVRALCELVADEVGLQRGQTLCDIGCGYGAAARLLARERGWRVTAVTISAAQHAFAQGVEPGASNPVYVLADWLRNNLPEASFEGAMAVESSEHMPDLGAFFREAHRVLCPGGRLVVCAWLSADRPTAWQQRHLLEPICREGRMPLMGTEEDYRRVAGEAGFSPERFQDLTRYVASTWPRIARTFLWMLCLKPGYVRFLFNRHARNRAFALTVFRLWWAYRSGAMRYGVFTFRRGGEAPGPCE